MSWDTLPGVWLLHLSSLVVHLGWVLFGRYRFLFLLQSKRKHSSLYSKPDTDSWTPWNQFSKNLNMFSLQLESKKKKSPLDLSDSLMSGRYKWILSVSLRSLYNEKSCIFPSKQYGAGGWTFDQFSLSHEYVHSLIPRSQNLVWTSRTTSLPLLMSNFSEGKKMQPKEIHSSPSQRHNFRVRMEHGHVYSALNKYMYRTHMYVPRFF